MLILNMDLLRDFLIHYLHMYMMFCRNTVTFYDYVTLCSPVLSSYTTVAVFHLRNCTRSRIA